MTESGKFYVATSIPYLNSAPHLGHALEIVQADAIARYQRMLGKDVFFLTGSDEHGAKVAKSAEAAGVSPQDFVDNQVGAFLHLLKALGVSNDSFIRTSNKEKHWLGAEKLWRELVRSGDIYKGFYDGLYCVGHEAFITEKDLENGVCPIHKKPPEHIKEENYFFRLSRYTAKIREAIEKNNLIILPESRKNETLRMLEDASDISFSRPAKDISWGIPVPEDASQTMYVWCDALSNYISAIGYSGDEENFARWWPCDLHVIGKDILRFHTVILPAMLLSAKLSLSKTVLVHGFINVAGDKMSKSLGNVIDPFALIAKHGKDAVRYYLLAEIPTLGDNEFSQEHFDQIYRGALVGGLGNLVSRIVTMLNSFSEIVRPVDEALARFPLRVAIDVAAHSEQGEKLESVTPSYFADQVALPRFQRYMEAYLLSDAAHEVWHFMHMLDEYIETNKIYKMIKDNPEDAKIAMWHLCYALAFIAFMITPLMPGTAERIERALGIENVPKKSLAVFRAGALEHLFPRLDNY